MASWFPKGGSVVDSNPQLLDLITQDMEWRARDGRSGCDGVADERKLELRLAPPGVVDSWSLAEEKRKNNSCGLSLTLSQKPSNLITSPCAGAKRGFTDALGPKPRGHKQQTQKSSLGKEPSSQNPVGIKIENKVQELGHERRTCSKQASPVTPVPSSGKATSAHNRFQKRIELMNRMLRPLCHRTSAAPVVGWPPIRSFQKNIASSSSKSSSPQENNDTREKNTNPEVVRKGMFVKINRDGIPIGRKIDLKAYSSYESLSSAVNELFSGVLAGQGTNPATKPLGVGEEKLKIAGLLDGNGEYTLVYEDNEGDMMLVGDVPWNMFISTVKRLRVLRTSELSSALTLETVGNKNRRKVILGI